MIYQLMLRLCFGFISLWLIIDLIAGDQSFGWTRLILLTGLFASGVVLFMKGSLPILKILEWLLFGLAAVYLSWDGLELIRSYLEANQVQYALTAWVELVALFSLIILVYCVLVPNRLLHATPMILLLAASPYLVGVIVWSLEEPSASLLIQAQDSNRLWVTMGLSIPTVILGHLAVLFIGSLRNIAVEARGKFMYNLVRKVGAGGMGEVWLGKHVMLSRPVAVKWIRSDTLEGLPRKDAKLAIAQFALEADATASLRSVHTIQIYDFGVTNNHIFYYAMEYLEGLDLEQLVERYGPVEPERVIYFLLQICKSLAEAHAKGMVHRDIKPQNVFVAMIGQEYDFIKVLDFGLVKPAKGQYDAGTQDKDLTTGTPAYMAPEMINANDAIDGRADIYESGCVAYWLLTGKTVFDEKTVFKMIAAHLSAQPLPPSHRTELEIPEQLDLIVLKCLNKDPADRFQSVTELQEALIQCQVSSDWNSDKAVSWWHTHKPERIGTTF